MLRSVNSCISVVVPVYNVEEYLYRCLNSVQKQSYKNIEVLMINDGSTDKSSEICQSFQQSDSRFKLYTKKNGGLSDARNFGINKASGDFITFVDSDDYVDEDYVEYLFNLIKKDGTEMSICQHRTVFTNKKSEIKGYDGPEKISAEYALKRLLYDDGIDTSTWAKLYKLELFSDINFPVGKLFEDIATTYKCIIKAKTISVGTQAKYNYIYREDSIVNNKFNESKLDLITLTKDLEEKVNQIYPNLRAATLRRHVYAELSTLNQMTGVSEYKTVRKKIIIDVRERGPKILKDSDAPERDKVAIFLLFLGYPIYSMVWKFYLKLKKGVSYKKRIK